MDSIESKDQQRYGRRYFDKYNEGFISYYLVIGFFYFFKLYNLQSIFIVSLLFLCIEISDYILF